VRTQRLLLSQSLSQTKVRGCPARTARGEQRKGELVGQFNVGAAVVAENTVFRESRIGMLE